MKYLLAFLFLWACFSIFSGPVIGGAGAALIAAFLVAGHMSDDDKDAKEKQQQEQLDRVEQLLRQRD
ncbi:MAG TPA: hypothetical protein VKQ70_04640 [Caulobacteraceae bacterium]|nr:hypothetical protein [Caulobacteraceae bacterium]